MLLLLTCWNRKLPVKTTSLALTVCLLMTGGCAVVHSKDGKQIDLYRTAMASIGKGLSDSRRAPVIEAASKVIANPKDRLAFADTDTLLIIDATSIRKNNGGANIQMQGFQEPSPSDRRAKIVPKYLVQNISITCSLNGNSLNNQALAFYPDGTSKQLSSGIPISLQSKLIDPSCKTYVAQLREQKNANEAADYKAKQDAKNRARGVQVTAFQRSLKRGNYVSDSFDSTRCVGMVTSVNPPLAVVEWWWRYAGGDYTNTRTEHITNLYPCER